MSRIDQVFAHIEGYREEVISLQKELTSRKALGPDNGGTGEHEKAEYLKGKLKELKPDHLEEIQAPDKRVEEGYRPNLLARWEGDKGSPTVWVLSHMDIVPPGDLALWGGDPYRIRVEGDKIIGRGVEDNQHGIVSSYMAVKAVLETGPRPMRSVGLALVADEETGSEYGLDYVLKNHPHFFKPKDLILVPDGGNEDGTMVEVAEKSMLWIKFTVLGKQCHGSTPEKGRNSLFAAARLIVELAKLKTEFDGQDDLFKPPVSTFEPTKMEANVPNVNTIPGRDVFYMDCRILPQYGVEQVFSYARELASFVGSELQVIIQVEPVYRQEATAPTSTSAPVVQALKKAIKEVKGLDAKPMGIGGGTVAAFFRRAGLPAAVWSTESDTPHQPDEYCLISNIMADAKVFATIFLEEG
jgi:succinyl-diaminopimelate desuccinylase